MLFHEYAVTPHVFDREYIENNSSAKIYLKIFLKSLRENGLLANMNNSDWLRVVNEYRKHLSPRLRDELSKIFEELSKRNRIVEHKTLIEPMLKEEIDWLNLALREDKIKPYSALLFTGKFQEPHEKTMTLEMLIANDFLSDEDMPLLNQTLENMEKYLIDFLAYAKRLIIIDPYFTFNEDDDNALLLFAKLFARRRGERIKNRKIIIQVFYNYNIKDEFEQSEYKQKWTKLFQLIYEKYGHSVTMNVWKDNNMHDRHMITDQGGISNSNGFSVYSNRKPHWSLLTNIETREQLNYFVENANPELKRKLVYSITKDFDTIVKNGFIGKVINIKEISKGKAGIVKGKGGEYNFTVSKLNRISKEIEPGINVEFQLKITGSEEIANIVKIVP